MSDETKVTLSAGELAMAQDTGIILTKRSVTEKASYLFSSLIHEINGRFTTVLAEYPELHSASPKISKGENYNGFPYVIMDHPAAFSKDNIFAVRTMFWWGNFISITLHLSGKYKTAFADKFFSRITEEQFYTAAGEEEWQHHFEENNFKLISLCSPGELTAIRSKPFLKIALRFDLKDWNGMSSLLAEGYGKVADLLYRKVDNG